jgi:outer membrane protein
MPKRLNVVFAVALAFLLPLLPAAGAAADQPSAAPSGRSEAVPADLAIRIGVLDLGRVGAESAQGKAAAARLKEKADKIQTQLTDRQKQLEKEKADLQAKLPALPPAQREEQAKAFGRKVEEYQKSVQGAEKELRALEEELGRKFAQEIGQAVGRYGDAEGFVAIVAKKDLLYLGGSVDKIDVTDAILKLLKEKGKKP